MAAEDGATPGRIAFEKATGITEGTWRGRYWARWSEAISEAGLTANRPPDRLGEKAVLDALVKVIRELGRIPTMPELSLRQRSDKSIPNVRTIQKYFPSKDDWIAALQGVSRNNSEYEDVRRLLPADPEDDGLTPPKDEASEAGFVYLGLLKIGNERRYKIGKSTSPDRRMGQIELVLPEKMHLVHVIRTDDPYGIEAYWHRRFAAKCCRGEWFKLSAADASAFKKRRTFM